MTTAPPRPSRTRHLKNLTLGCLLLAARVPAQAQSPLEGLDAYVRQAVTDWGVPGLAVAVVKDGEFVFSAGYGVREAGSGDAVDPHTLFAIGSTTKAMTAAAIGMLVDEGKLGWDDPVVRHLPDFRLSDPWVTSQLTVRDLLTHRAGVGNADFLWYGQENETDEILFRLRYADPETSMRSHFTYQNIMYVAAGKVIEKVSGISWASFIQHRVFDPLGMAESVPLLSMAETRDNVASPHYRLDGKVTVIENASVDPVAPAGSVWSSVHDMAKWLRFLLAGGVTEDGERLLSEGVHAELFRPQMLVDAGGFYPTARLTRPHWTTYGLGWFQADYQGRATDFHTGSIDGMVAIAGLIRDEDLGVYVLGNLDHAEVRHAIMYRVFDLYGPAEPRDWSAELQDLYGALRAQGEQAAQRAQEDRIADTSPSLPLEAYAGAYIDPLYGTVEVSLQDGALRVHYGPGLQGPADHWHFDTFGVKWDARWRGSSLVSFRLDARGNVAGLEVNGATFERIGQDSSR